MQMDDMVSGSMMAPKASIIIHYVERGKPYVLLKLQGIDPVRERNGTEGKGKG